jgi:hypothetical protein
MREHGEAFLVRHGGHLTEVQRKALRDLPRCRTAALGGHVQRCRDCGDERISYNSCRNRHCPKCQALSRAQWLERESTFLLPTEYYHVVFTLPQEVAEVALGQPSLYYNLLFQAASATLREVAANPKHLGAQIGVLMVLHTWGQNLHHHPHLHCVCTGGGLSCDAQGIIDETPTWVSCRPGFFLPVRVLSRLFRGKYLALLKQAFVEGKLTGWPDVDAMNRWLTPLYAKDWVVYAKPPFGGPERVLKYLARYTHRVAISNHRLISLEDGQVTFRFKDYANSNRQKTMKLSADEFLRRFVQHVLPRGFVKIRHYGLLANRDRAERLHVCRKLLLPVKVAAQAATAADCAEPPVTINPAPKRCCPNCGSERLRFSELPKSERVAACPADSS